MHHSARKDHQITAVHQHLLNKGAVACKIRPVGFKTIRNHHGLNDKKPPF